MIFLGIDDGLARDPAVLDYLQANRIPFTAFMVQGPLQADPAFWQRARSIGGVIEAHTLAHPNLTKVTGDRMRNEICGSADVDPGRDRPPAELSARRTARTTTPCVRWRRSVGSCGSDVEGLDERRPRVDFQENQITPGDILLMHWRPDCSTT